MARIAKNKDKWHRITVATDRNNGEVLLVGRGKRAYLWAGRNEPGSGCVIVSGPATLRKLAHAILREVGN